MAKKRIVRAAAVKTLQTYWSVIAGHGEEPDPWIRYTKDSQPLPLDSPIHSLQPAQVWGSTLADGLANHKFPLCTGLCRAGLEFWPILSPPEYHAYS
ncbi:unnamed protein product [Caretta caretta]